MAFTETFGGTTIYPSDVSYRAISLSANQTLAWPLEVATSGNVVAQIMDVTPSAGGFTITMPPANEASPGETALFFNAGSFNFTVADNAGNTIVTITPGLAYQVYLRTNTTVAGTWRSTQFGAGTSSATAGSLVGAGIKAINTTLNQSMAVTSLSVNYTAGAADRSAAFLWTGGAGTITLPAASTVGNDWFFHIRNGGTGAISLATTGGELINGTATVDFNPGDSAIIVCDGTGYFTIGFGQAPEFLFDYVSIDLTSQSSPYTLAGSNLNRIAYQFSGTLTTNMQIIVPATIQQYWVGNFTTGGSYTLTVKTSAGTGVVVPRDARAILYCNGTDVVTADTGGISIPILVSQGGTGATNASSARTNLGATSIGNALFIAVDAATARNAIIAAKSGANSDITSLTGLTTPLSVPQGGTGAATFTANGLIYGSGASALGVTAVGTTGQVLVGNTGGAPSWATLSGIGVTSFSAGTTGLTPSAATSGAITLAGTLIVANGGTGATTLTGYVKGSGTSALTASATIPATDISGGAALTKTDDTNVTLTLGGTPASALLAATSLTLGWSGQLSVARGGTGQSSYTDGQLLIGNSTGNTLTKATLTAGTNVSITNGAGSITINATDQFVGTVTSVSGTGTVNGITLTGTVTSSGSLTLGGTLSGVSLTTQVTGTLPVGNGGTGATTLTANGVLYGAGTSAIAATAVGTTGQVLVGNTGAAPSWATLTGIGVTSFSGGTTGLTPASATTGAITLAGTLAVANGGTGVTTSTGTGSVVLSNSPTLVTPVLGAASATSVTAALGSVTAPSFTFTGDTNTGIWSPAADTIAFSEGGVEAMRIDSSGNVGIGTTTITPIFGRTVKIYNAGSGGTLEVGGSTINARFFGSEGAGIAGVGTTTNTAFNFVTNDTERMRLDTSGNVGIGTSSPTSRLEVAGSIRTTQSTGGVFNMQYTTANAASRSWQINHDVQVYGDFAIQQSTTQTGNTYADRLYIDAGGNVGIGTSSPTSRLTISSGQFTSPALNIIGGGPNQGWLRLGNNADIKGGDDLLGMTFTVGASERMKIDTVGNVGIGTTGPLSRLDVREANRADGTNIPNVGIYTTTAQSTGVGGTLALGGLFNGSDTAPFGSIRGGKQNSTSGNYDGYLAFQTIANGGVLTEKMRIDSTGKAGLGTNNPTELLTINGVGANAGYPLITFNDQGTNRGQIGYTFDLGYFHISSASTLAFRTAGTERARIDSSGNLLVGTTSALGKVVASQSGSADVFYAGIGSAGSAFTVVGTASTMTVGYFVTSSGLAGSISCSGTSTTYATSSDLRLKDNITDADDAASLIDALQVRKFDWKSDNSHQRYGFVAQELVTVAPEAVSQPADPDDMMGVDYSKLVPMLVKEIQSLRARVAQLEGN
jgi:hypothetical protein